MTQLDMERFNTLKEQRETWYKNIKEVSCGYFPGEKIQKYFWSIIPNWKMSGDGRRKLHHGNPEED